jgi:hypothetical protein
MTTETETIKYDPELQAEADEYRKELDIQSLKDIINELQNNKLKLIIHIDELKEQIKTQRSDHTDVYFYLNKKCDDAFETIESLEIQILKEHDDRSKAEAEYNRIIDDNRNKALTEGNSNIILSTSSYSSSSPSSSSSSSS